MNREEQLKKLSYGSLNGIREGIKMGAGVLYRKDIMILIDYIKELENIKCKAKEV